MATIKVIREKHSVFASQDGLAQILNKNEELLLEKYHTVDFKQVFITEGCDVYLYTMIFSCRDLVNGNTD